MCYLVTGAPGGENIYKLQVPKPVQQTIKGSSIIWCILGVHLVLKLPNNNFLNVLNYFKAPCILNILNKGRSAKITRRDAA
jgi:hypothetical protein